MEKGQPIPKRFSTINKTNSPNVERRIIRAKLKVSPGTHSLDRQQNISKKDSKNDLNSVRSDGSLKIFNKMNKGKKSRGQQVLKTHSGSNLETKEMRKVKRVGMGRNRRSKNGAMPLPPTMGDSSNNSEGKANKTPDDAPMSIWGMNWCIS